MKIKKSILLFLVLLMIFPTVIYGQESRQPFTAEIKVVAGFKGNVKTGSQIPLTVIVVNKGERLKGELSVRVPVKSDSELFSPESWLTGEGTGGRKNRLYTFSRKVDIEPGKTTHEVFYVDVPLYDSTVYVELTTGDRVIDQKKVPMDLTENQTKILAGIICDDHTGLEKINGMALDIDRGYSKNVYILPVILREKDIFPNPDALKHLDMLIVDENAAFTREQEQALESWKNQGGCYVVKTEKTLDQTIMDQIYGPGTEQFQNHMNKMQTFEMPDVLNIDLVPVRHRPSMGLIVGLVILYILLAGPGMYILFNKKRKLKYLGAGIVVLSVIFVIIIKIAGIKTSFSAPFISSCGEYQQDGDIWKETYDMSIQAPFNSKFQLYLDQSEYDVQIINAGYEGTEYRENEKYEEVLMEDQIDKVRVTMGNMSSFTRTYFRLNKEQTLEEEQCIQVQLTGDGDKIKGSWSNPTGYTLKNTIFVTKNRIAVLGDMEQGKQGSIEGAEIISHGTDGVRPALDKLLDISGYDFPEYEVDRLSEKAELLERNMAPEDGYILGIISNPDLDFQKNSGYQVYGITLFSMPAGVDWTGAEGTCIPNLEAYGRSYDSSYNSTTNLMNQRDITIDYNGDRLTKIDSMDMYPQQYYAEKYFVPFEGSISIYNWEKKVFEILDNRNGSVRINNMNGYVSDNGIIRIQYIQDDALNSMGKTPMLPCIKVTGKVE